MLLSDVWRLSVWRLSVCLTSVCLSVAYIGPKSRTERPRKTILGLGHYFQGQKVKSQGHQVTLLTAALTRQAAAAVSVGTYWAWETTATLRCARRRKALQRPQREERGGGISWRQPTYSLFIVLSVCRLSLILLRGIHITAAGSSPFNVAPRSRVLKSGDSYRNLTWNLC